MFPPPRMPGLVLALALAAGAGCGSAAPVVSPVEGVVKVDGKPAGNLLIQFTPMAWAKDRPVTSASAVSDPAGRFILKADDGQPGAPVGTHKVTVVDNNLSVEGEPDQPGGRKKVVNRVPQAYGSAVSTPLEVEVRADKKDYELTLSSTPPRR